MFFQYRIINNEIKLIQDNVRPDIENKSFWDNEEYNKVFVNWQDGDILYVGDAPLINPIIDGENIREMNIIEQIDNGLYQLFDGQYVENGEIKFIEQPTDMYFPKWNKEMNTWVDTVTKEYFIELRASKIIEYSKLESDKKIIEGSKFASEDEILDISNKMSELEEEINELKTKIDAM